MAAQLQQFARRPFTHNRSDEGSTMVGRGQQPSSTYSEVSNTKPDSRSKRQLLADKSTRSHADCRSRRKMRRRYLEVLTHSLSCQCGQNSVGTVIGGLLWCRVTAQGKILLHTCNDSLCWFLLYFVNQETTSLKTGLITVCFFCNYCQLTYHHLI